MIDWYYKTYHIPSITVAIVEKGQVVKYISRGQLSRDNDSEKTDENSCYQIASTSKTLTGMICRSLELEGKLDVDKSIVEYLDLNENSKKKYKDVTLRHVIHHRSGLGRSMYAYAEKDILNALNETELEFTPDSKYQYSNFGYALVSLILEKATNKSYAELLKEYVSDKYILPGFYASRDVVPSQHLVTPYWKHFRLRENTHHDFGIQVGASGVFTNTKTLSSLMIQQIEAYQSFDSLKNSSPLILTHPKAELSEGDDDSYGYGLFEFNYDLDDQPDVLHMNLEHGGDADGFACIYDFFPEYQAGMVIQTSSGGQWLNQMSWHLNGLLIRRNANVNIE